MDQGTGKEYICSFCGKTQTQVGRLIAGQNKVFICDECVTPCAQIVGGEEEPASEDARQLAKPLIP